MTMLPGDGETRDRASSPPRLQVFPAVQGIVAGHDGGVRDLLVRVCSRLARLQLHEVQNLVTLLEEQVVKAQKGLRPLVEGGRRPPGLCVSGAKRGRPNVGRHGVRHPSQGVSAEGDLDGNRLARLTDRREAGADPLENRRVHGPPSPDPALGGLVCGGRAALTHSPSGPLSPVRRPPERGQLGRRLQRRIIWKVERQRSPRNGAAE